MIRYFLLLMIVISNYSKATITWNHSNKEFQEKVISIITDTEKNKPTEYTEVYSQSDISIKNEKVVQKNLRIYYFPDSQSIQDFGYDYIRFNDNLDAVVIDFIGAANNRMQFFPVNKADLKINDSNSYNTFSSYKNAVFNYPSLDKGSYGIIKYTIVTDRAKQESDWSRELFPQYNFPRRLYKVNVSWDGNSVFSSNKSAHIKCNQSSNNLSCEGVNIPAIKTNDAISWLDELDSLQIGTLKTWEDTVKLASDKFFSAVDTYELDIGKFVSKLIEKEEDVEKQIDLMYRFVAQDIQYTSHSEHGNAITPHAVTRTLEKRFGDCKDKAALFYSMLSDINVYASPVLVATDRLDSKKLSIPSLNYFDHMIVCFQVNKKNACADLTNYHSDWRYVSPHIQGKASLDLLSKNGPKELYADKTRWKLVSKRSLEFDKKGNQKETNERTYIYEYASTMRSTMASLTEDQITKQLTSQYNDQVAKGVSPSFSVTGLKDLNAPVVISSKTQFESIVSVNEDLNYAERDVWIANELDGLIVSNKDYGTWIGGVEITSSTTFFIPSIWNIVSPPSNIYLNHKFGILQRNIKNRVDGKFDVVTKISVPRQYIRVEIIKEFNELVDLFKRESTLNLYAKLR